MGISGVCCHLLLFDVYILLHDLGCETDIWGWSAMVELALLKITYLLFYGLVGMSIINVALAIAILFLLHRQ